MGEYMGSEPHVALQKALHARSASIAENPLLSNGGRILNILDPAAFGWDRVREVALQDGFVGLTMVDRDGTLARLPELFEGQAEFPFWQVFTGTPQEVVPACDQVTARGLPQGWTVTLQTHPDDETIAAAQALNIAVGVAPAPGYYLRGHEIPSMLASIHDEAGVMVACASGTMRYHPQSKLAGWFFAGGVSVSPDHRRKGLGARVNAALLSESQRRFSWVKVLAQAKADNLPSVGMIKSCGLQEEPGKVTVVINLTGAQISR